MIAVRWRRLGHHGAARYFPEATPRATLIFGDGAVHHVPAAIGVRVPEAVVPEHQDSPIFQARQAWRGIGTHDSGGTWPGPVRTVILRERFEEVIVLRPNQHPDNAILQLNDDRLNPPISVYGRGGFLQFIWRLTPGISVIV